MRKYLARRLRRAANRLDPQPTFYPAVTATASTSANVVQNFTFHPEAAGRRAVRKHGKALRRLGVS